MIQGARSFVAVLVFLFSSIVYSGENGTSYFLQNRYPLDVQLKHLLKTPPPIQDYGSCHVYAAATAAQAACARRTGRVYEISGPHLFAQHLKSKALISISFPFLDNDESNLFSKNDAGEFKYTIERIRNSQYVRDGAYSKNQLEYILMRASRVRTEYNSRLKQGYKPEQIKSRYEIKMRTSLILDIDASLKASAEPDKIIRRDCLFNRLQLLDFKPTYSNAVALLAKGFPFICQYYTQPVGSVSHVVLFTGYKAPNDEKGYASFYVRDSATALITYLQAFNCYKTAVVFYPEEREKIKSLRLLN